VLLLSLAASIGGVSGERLLVGLDPRTAPRCAPRLLVHCLFAAVLAGCASGPRAPAGEVIGVGVFESAPGVRVRASYRADGTVHLRLPQGGERVLWQVPAASGARYASGEAQWWEHHGEATYSVGGEVRFTGALVDDSD